MAGKAYTMREMRAIVEYLTERKAYGEIKGRKMWMEYANSEKTIRTWQSLKETFLKRILPDIQNPYYKLTMDQVCSFKQGYDVAEREKNNRLEFRTATEDSNGDSHNATEQPNKKKNNEPPTTSNNNELSTRNFDNEQPTTSIDEELEKATGEGITSAKIPSRSRSSADTVVLEYENADELQRVLESPINDENEGKSKSFKDLLTFEYSAPLTPLVRNLLDDFETESEASDKEPQLNIDENPQKTIENTESEPKVIEDIPSESHNINNDAESPIEIRDMDDSANVTVKAKDVETSKAKVTAHIDVQEKGDVFQKNTSLHLKKSQTNKKEDNANLHESVTETSLQDNVITDADTNNITEFVTAESNAKTFKKSPDADQHKKDCNNTNANTENSMQNTGNTSSDTILPNNQEALDGSKRATQKINVEKAGEDLGKLNKNNNRGKIGDNLEKGNHDEKGSGKLLKSQDRQETKVQKLSDNTSKKSKEDEVSISIIDIIDTPTEHDTASLLEKNTGIPDTKIIEINTDTPTSTEKQFNDLQKTVLQNTVTASTSSEKDVSKHIVMTEEKDIEIVEDKNPCLLSVSLFDEQFKNTKYSDSDSDDERTPVPKQNLNRNRPHLETNGKNQTEDEPQKEVDNKKEPTVKIVKNIQKSGGILESSADCEPQRQGMVNKKNNVDSKVTDLQREKALANIFGFAHGIGVPTGRKRHLSHRKRSHHYRRRHSKNNDSNSSEWTSESDSESYISPPRGRRNRHTRKYLKPKSSRILQDPEEGMLYVIFGKNIYPLVKDGTHIKNFLTYRPDSGSDMEEESYWRQKYINEKKRVEEVKKQLKGSQERRAPQINAPTSPILPSPSRNTTTRSQQKPVQNENSKELAVGFKVENKTESKDSKMVLKIAAKDGLEYCLEGGWSQISSAIPQMVRMLQSETTASNSEKFNSPQNKTVDRQPSKINEPLVVSSGLSTPVIQPIVDPEVHEKVNKLEKEIFKEIEDLEKEQQNEMESTNVTKRKLGRPRKESSSSSITVTQSPSKKRARVSQKSSTELKQESAKPTKNKRTKPNLDLPKEQIESKQEEIRKPTTRAKTRITGEHELIDQQTETAKLKESNPIMMTEVIEKPQNNGIGQKAPKRRESLRISKQKGTVKSNGSVASSEVSLGGTRSSARLARTPKKYDADSSASDIKIRPRSSISKETTSLLGFDEEDARYMFPPSPINNKKTPKGKNDRSLLKMNIVPPQEKTSRNSVDSTQGYQDSDGSPMKFCLPRRKKKVSLSTRTKYKNRRLNRRKSHPILIQELLSDSNNSSYFVPLRRSQSTLNSEVYRTDSFQLLLPKEKRSFSKLERINETSPSHQIDPSIRHFNSVSQNSNKSYHENSNIIVEVCSSSAVSLPLSPELSVVENLSISREMIKSENHPTINEIQSNGNSHAMDFSEYMISNIDISLPLMNNQCELQKSTEKLTPQKKTAKSPPLSHPFFGKECTVRIENLTLSETLDQRLRDLLLESSKKTTIANNNKDNTIEVNQTKITTTKEIRTRALKTNAMEIDESKIASTKKNGSHLLKENAMEVGTATTKKTRAKKRSSTPQKKKTAKKATAPKDPVIEEEHMESCSFASRKSCPPVMTYLPIYENANDFPDDTHNPVKVNTRKKKDVIKVKICRPNTRSRGKVLESVENVSVTSTYTDSGINDTGTNSRVFLKESEDNVDLIHNHSETCLLANECIENSVQFVENSNSIVSLSSSEQSVLSELQKILDDAASLSGELFSDSRDKVTSDPRTSEGIYESPERAYHTPAATNSSLITEDLSDDPPTLPTKWYLLSEDDNTQLASNSMASYGSNLMQIFPVTYAVPDLSTISEMSKENGDSRNPNFDTDGDTGDYNLQNLI